jgi:dynein heavy chain
MMDDLEWRFLLAGPSGDIKIAPNPTIWIDENAWPEIYR